MNNLNNTISCKENYEIILYADDTSIFVACKSLESAQIAVNEILTEIDKYMSCNLLHINLDKSCFMYFPPNRKFLTMNHACKKTVSKSNKLQAKGEKYKLQDYQYQSNPHKKLQRPNF